MRNLIGSAWPAATVMTCAVMAGAMLSGCSGTAINSNPISSNVAKTTTQTVVTDAPADQVLSLSLTVDSIVLTDTAGKTATVLSTPVTVEASHLDAVQEPLLPPLSIPQDTYVSATIVSASPVVVYVDPATGKAVTSNAVLTSGTTTVTFSTPITVGTTSAPLCFDLLVGQSVSISGTTVDVTPTWNVTAIPLMAQPVNQNNGKVSGVVGKVVSASGTTLVLTLPNGQSLTITTDSNTVYQGVTSLSALTAGEIVDVDVAQQQGGGLLALRVHLVPAPAGALFVGPVTAETGSPVTSFSQLVRQAVGSSVTAGSTETVTVTGATTFGLAPQLGTLPALPFAPAFSASTLFAGQNVAVAASSVSGTTATATSVTLAPQTVDGTVASVTTAGPLTVYNVTLPSSSALGTLTGAATVTVYTWSSTQMMNATSLGVGSAARFNGLLFKSGGGGLVLVAGASCDGPVAAPPQKH